MNQEQVRRKYMVILIAVHICAIMLLFCTILALGKDYQEILLHDDGYYRTAGRIVKGEPIYSMYGLGYPIVLTLLYPFPSALRPFLRLLISISITSCAIILIFRIFRNYLTDKEIFLGGLAFVLNPLYVHWMFKSRVEAPLVMLLGLLILISQKYILQRRIKHLVFAAIFMAACVFTKPVVLLIPIFVTIAAPILRSRRILSLGIIIGIASCIAFIGTRYLINLSGQDRQYYAIHGIVGSAFYVDAIVRNKDFQTQYMFVEDENGNRIRNPELVPGDNWITEYIERYGSRNEIMMSIRLIYERPGMFIQQLLLNPFLAFSLCCTEQETFVHFGINLSLMVLAILGMHGIRGKNDLLYIHLVIVFSVYFLLVLVHSRGPYFVPLIPYLFVFAGKPLRSFYVGIRSFLRRKK